MIASKAKASAQKLGLVTVSFPDGSSYKGQWQGGSNGVMEGEGSLTNSFGDVYTGHFKNSQR